MSKYFGVASCIVLFLNRYRVMIDPEKGVYRGFTNIVTAVPHSIAYEETPTAFRDHAPNLLFRTLSIFQE